MTRVLKLKVLVLFSWEYFYVGNTVGVDLIRNKYAGGCSREHSAAVVKLLYGIECRVGVGDKNVASGRINRHGRRAVDDGGIEKRRGGIVDGAGGVVEIIRIDHVTGGCGVVVGNQ